MAPGHGLALDRRLIEPLVRQPHLLVTDHAPLTFLRLQLLTHLPELSHCRLRVLIGARAQFLLRGLHAYQRLLHKVGFK